MSEPAREPWWEGRLAFECTACGRCCVNHGEGYEFVFSTVAERHALARHLGVTLREFERRFCERRDGALSFASRGEACVFLDERGRCSVYALRPTQCRTFPFWPELLEDEETWERDVASFCPGVGRGPPRDREEIEAAMRRAGSPL